MENNHPEIAATINEYFMPATKSPDECGADRDAQVTYIASWIAQAEVHAEKAKYDINIVNNRAYMIDDENIRGTSIRWENYSCEPFNVRELSSSPEFTDAEYQQPAAWMMDARLAKTYETDFVTWLSRDCDLNVLVNEKLGMSAQEGEMSADEFIDECKEKVEELAQKEIDKLTRASETKIKTLETKLEKARVNLNDKETASKMRKIQTGAAVAETVLGLFGVGRKKSVSTSLNKAGQISSSQNALEKAQLEFDDINNKLEDLQNDLEAKIDEVRERWNGIAENTSEVRVDVSKKDCYVDLFGICWMPYYKNSIGKLVRAF